MRSSAVRRHGDSPPRTDGFADFDNDGVRNYQEYIHGTDPFALDTDDDALPDYAEIVYDRLDPTDPDSDDDGTLDRAEDYDDDGLVVAEELNNETNPFVADTDRDGIDDGAELRNGTDPLSPDTDQDGLTDAAEPTLGFDPTDPDTDDDGVLDGNETIETTTRNATYGVNVTFTGAGDVASTATIENGDRKIFEQGAASEAQVTEIVNLEAGADFEQAEVTFEYNQSAVENESNLAVYRYNTTLQTFVRLNSSVDAANDSVSATTEHFSRFVVFNVKNWQESLTARPPAPTSPATGGNNSSQEVRPVDVVYVIDSSGSMGFNDPNGFRKQAAKEFTGALLPQDRGAVVDFDSYAFVRQALTTDKQAVNASIDRLDAFGGTNIGAGVRTANQHFAAKSNDSRAKVALDQCIDLAATVFDSFECRYTFGVGRHEVRSVAADRHGRTSTTV